MDFSTLSDEIAALAHRCWCKRMVAAGWRPGKVMDPGAGTHDVLRPYAELTPEDRARLRFITSGEELEAVLGDSVALELEQRPLSATEVYVGMKVRMVGGDPADVGRIRSWTSTRSEPLVIDEITVKWPNGDEVAHCPAEYEIEPVTD